MAGSSDVPVGTSVAVEGNAEATRTEDGAVLCVSPEAAAGERLTLVGAIKIGPEGRRTTIRTTRTIHIAKPLAVSLVSEGNDGPNEALRVAVTLRNNRSAPMEVSLRLDEPEGWIAAESQTLTLPARSEDRLTVLLEPKRNAAVGSVEVAATATAADAIERTSCSMFHIPAKANLLRNAGFEDGVTAWSTRSDGRVEIDTAIARGGTGSVRISNHSTAHQSQVSQTIALNQKRPCPILVRAASRAENVSGGQGRGYSLYVDIYYMDGTPLYGQTVDFKPGTHDWEVAERIIDPKKPIRNVNVYLLLRGKTGTAWFDDVAVAEDL
jgi:hypothetical protein